MIRRSMPVMGAFSICWLCAGGLGWAESVSVGILDAANRIAEDQPRDPVAPPPIVIQQQPVAQAIMSGQKATFSVVAEGNGLTYQWQRNGTPDLFGWTGGWVNVTSLGQGTGVTTATYETEAVSNLYNGIQHRVIVREAGGATLTSQIVGLTVSPSGPVPTVPGVPTLTQLSTTSVRAGWTASTITSGSIYYNVVMTTSAVTGGSWYYSAGTNALFYNFTNVPYPTYSTFYVRVRALSSTGGGSNYSNWSGVNSITITP